jgi:hypothetical protein
MLDTISTRRILLSKVTGEYGWTCSGCNWRVAIFSEDPRIPADIAEALDDFLLHSCDDFQSAAIRRLEN